MLNPILSNFRTDFGDSFFPEAVTQKYDDFLIYKNSPLKSIAQVLYESIQEVNIPGINLQTIAVNNLPNLSKYKKDKLNEQVVTTKYFPGTAGLNEVVDGTTVTITFRNTILNWMYCYEMLREYYKRDRNVEDFYIQLILKDSAGIDMIKYTFNECFASGIPGLTFSTNTSFLETKTFECTFTFSRMKTEFIIPTFDIKKFEL